MVVATPTHKLKCTWTWRKVVLERNVLPLTASGCGGSISFTHHHTLTRREQKKERERERIAIE